MATSIIKDRPQADGRRKVTIDCDGFLMSRLVSADWRLTDHVEAIEASVLQSRKQSELADMPNRVGSGLTPEQLLSSAQYATPQEIIREGIRYGLETENVYDVAMMQGIYTYLQANYTTEQLSALTGWTVDTINAFNARMVAAFTTGSVSEQILAVESLRGEAE